LQASSANDTNGINVQDVRQKPDRGVFERPNHRYERKDAPPYREFPRSSFDKEKPGDKRRLNHKSGKGHTN
jgi:hypothetical protein